MEKILDMQRIYMDVLWRRCTCGEDVLHMEKILDMQHIYMDVLWRRCTYREDVLHYGEDVKYAAYLYGCAMEKMYMWRRYTYREDVLHYGEDVHIEKMCCIWRRCAAYGEDVLHMEKMCCTSSIWRRC